MTLPRVELAFFISLASHKQGANRLSHGCHCNNIPYRVLYLRIPIPSSFYSSPGSAGTGGTGLTRVQKRSCEHTRRCTNIPMKTAQGGPQRTKNGLRLSRFVFTVNNWTQPEYDHITTIFAPSVKWIIVAKETGSNGTPHLQGACILGTQCTLSKLKTLTGFKRAHIECMRGTPEESRMYCTKEDKAAFQMGTMPAPGKRTDISQAVSRIQGGESLKDLSADEAGGIAIVKFHKGLTILRSLTRPPRTGAPGVFWFYGPTGVGKTRVAYKCARALCQLRGMPKTDVWISSGGLRWFDGYDGHTCAIFDDFRAKHVSSFAFLLRLLDRYPVSCEFKGGFVSWTPSFIFITCPEPPEVLFSTRKEHVPEDIAQLNRRISKQFEISDILDKPSRSDFVRTISNMVMGE